MPDDGRADLLSLHDLHVHFHTTLGTVRAVNGVSLRVPRNHVMGLVGESGCGKSVTARAVLRIIPPPGRIENGRVLYHPPDGGAVDLALLSPTGRQLRAIRGRRVAMTFQEPMTCLSPVHRIGLQITEAIRAHEPVSRTEARERAVALLADLGMPNPERQLDAYTFELSGGMRQRAMIAVALAANPELLIADEPTTAVDVTIQARIMELLRSLQQSHAMSVLFISHDLNLVAEMSEQIAVMYLGKIVERGDAGEVYRRPRHPYTKMLMACVPHHTSARKTPLQTIEGTVPDARRLPRGCPFSARCSEFMPGVCDRSMPALTAVGDDHEVACFLHSDQAEGGVAVPSGGVSSDDG